MVIVRGIAYEGEYVKMKFFRVIKVGEKFPSKSNARRLYTKSGNEVIKLRWRGDGKNIKKEQQRKDGNEENAISKKEHNKAQKES